MTDSMIEKAARAAHEAHKPWCDYTYPFDHEMASREVYFTLARAVLQALREPDEGMAEAAYQASELDERWCIEDDADWGRSFTAAIDHILNESKSDAES